MGKFFAKKTHFSLLFGHSHIALRTNNSVPKAEQKRVHHQKSIIQFCKRRNERKRKFSEKTSHRRNVEKSFIKSDTTTTTTRAKRKTTLAAGPTYFSALRHHSPVWSAFNKVHSEKRKAPCSIQFFFIPRTSHLIFFWLVINKKQRAKQPRKGKRKTWEIVWKKSIGRGKDFSSARRTERKEGKAWGAGVGRTGVYNNRKQLSLSVSHVFVWLFFATKFSTTSHQLMASASRLWLKFGFSRTAKLLSSSLPPSPSPAPFPIYIIVAFVIRKRVEEKFEANWLPV